MTDIDRRTFLHQSALASGVLLAPSLAGLISCSDPTAANQTPLRLATKGEGGYGELIPSSDVNELISIPAGFHAALLSTAGDEMEGGVVPYAMDGMAAFAAAGGLVRLVRNHELRDVPSSNPKPFGAPAYDSIGPGGNTTLEVRGAARWKRDAGEAVCQPRRHVRELRRRQHA